VGASTVAVYLSPYMQQLGANGDQIGIALIIATATEFPVFYVGNSLVKKFGSSNLFLIALILIGVRSILYAVAATPIMVYAVQAFSGMIFPAMWSAGVAFADENAPVGLKSTAQGIFGAMSFGFGSAVGGLLGGPLLENLGGRGMFLVFGIIILVGVILIEAVKRMLPEKELVQPEIS
jgi:MFS transporter, PPP family, 3-phenylpropionic acid transporter